MKMIVKSLKEEKMYVKFSNNMEAEQRGSYLDVKGIKWVMSRSWHCRRSNDFVVYYDARSKIWKHAWKKVEVGLLVLVTTEVSYEDSMTNVMLYCGVGRRSEAKKEFKIYVQQSDLAAAAVGGASVGGDGGDGGSCDVGVAAGGEWHGSEMWWRRGVVVRRWEEVDDDGVCGGGAVVRRWRRWELPAKVNKARVTMSSATSDVTYTSVYTDSEPGRAFWGADDEEISEGGIPRVIVLGYDGLPLQPVAPPSPDFMPGPENPQTPPVPQDEDEREPMFIQAHDPNYVPEPIYPEYIPLEDDHEFQAEEQPLPPVDSPTAESPGYVTESDPEEDPEGYEDDETEDGPVDYPMDGGDDDDGDSSRDDARDEDEDEEDEEDEEEEEHLAPADSTTVIPADEPVFPPEGTEPVIPPPSTDITIGARITVRPQTSISLPPEAEVERLLTMTTPSPSPPISLSPPSAGERLARCMAPPAHSPPLPPSSGCLTQIQTLRIASTQALIDAVTGGFATVTHSNLLTVDQVANRVGCHPAISLRGITILCFAATTWGFSSWLAAFSLHLALPSQGKYELVKSMLNSSTRIFSFQFSSMDGLDAMLENCSWFIRNNPRILKKWNPDVNLLKEDVVNVSIWVKLHGVPG
ncbi:putative reverse transcriptase domain-containing protein [Tanacetum coccineum]